MIIVNGFQPLIVITKRSILDVAAMLKLVIVIAGKYLKLVQHFILSFGPMQDKAFCPGSAFRKGCCNVNATITKIKTKL